jgi:Putative Se/S carrier protein-like
MPLFKKKPSFEGGGLVLFMDVHDAMAAEKVLKESDYAVKLVAPPPELRKGCDLALEINLVEQPGIERLLKEKEAGYVSVTPMKPGTSRLLEIVKVTDFGDWLMVKAANMKLSFEKKSGIIVNTSGGGCPDIPYLHAEMIDKRLDEAPRPKDLGFTLCALMLDRALEESLALWRGGSKT